MRRCSLLPAWMILGLAVAVPARGADDPGSAAFFESKIRPILIERCYSCHSARAAKVKGGLRLDSRVAVRAGGESGSPAVVPGKPEESALYQAIARTGDATPMPPKEPLPASVVADFRRWIERGALDPRDSPLPVVPTQAANDDWWSLRPIVRSPVPIVPGAASPIDAFLMEKSRAAGLELAPEADRRTLIRRVSFDLIGLPPTTDEIDAFLADPALDAYERVVDRLLASPHFGERQARRWMDLAHFAETHGHDQDRIRPNAWPYRDYLIASFNRDTPYARFVEEQVATDVLFPDDPARSVALGFLAAGPWDESSLRDIREDSIDRQIGRYLDRDDVVTTVMSTFVSSTVQCARCHDHKFDPFSQEEYYGLQAVFAGVDRADRAYDPDPAVHALRRDLTARRKALQARDPALWATLLDPVLQAEVASWEAGLASARLDWTVLAPDESSAQAGSTLRAQPDQSLLAEGTRPAEETYTILASTRLRGITGVRLEVLPDDRLPSHGPGRNENGNLHLTEFQVKAAPRSNLDSAVPVPVARAVADFDQAGWGIAGAIDGNPMTAWGIYPEVARPHQAVFEFAAPLEHSDEQGTTLTFVLRQSFPVNHPIGRFRLSATTSPHPARIGIGTIPAPIAALVAVPRAQRTAEQSKELAALFLAQSIDNQIAAVPAPKHVYAAARDFAPDGSHKPAVGPRPVTLLKRGDIHKPGAPAVPGALACVRVLPARFDSLDPADEGARRAALARWLSDPKNPLTWRSIVNRAWLDHFGKGIVDTPSDFGRMGGPPSHPALLDWLAATFLKDGGSWKQLQRRIVTSAAYRRSSRHDPKAAAVDADNRLLWRMNRTRLDAESLRDAVLMISGHLDRTMGGPSVQQFALGKGVHVTPTVDYSAYSWESPGAGRRSIYRFLFRTLPDPFVDTFDGADASQLTAVRNASITSLQALALLNDRFILHHAERFARSLEGEAPDLAGRVRAAFLRALGRPPTPEETRDWTDYAARHGLANACRMLLNSNEFLFLN